MIKQIIVEGFPGDKMTIDVGTSDADLEEVTVGWLKMKIAERLPGDPGENAQEMQLTFAGTRLNDDSKSLAACGLLHKSIVRMVLFLDGGMAV